MEEKRFLKEMVARQNVKYLIKNLEINLKGKKVLDIGFKTGENAREMSLAGAEVYGCEPDEESFMYAMEHNMLSREKAYMCHLHNMPKMIEMFDMATIFLMCFESDDLDKSFETLAKLLKKDGILVMSFSDDEYHKKEAERVLKLLGQYNLKSNIHKASLGMINPFFIVAQKERKMAQIHAESEHFTDRVPKMRPRRFFPDR